MSFGGHNSQDSDSDVEQDVENYFQFLSLENRSRNRSRSRSPRSQFIIRERESEVAQILANMPQSGAGLQNIPNAQVPNIPFVPPQNNNPAVNMPQFKSEYLSMIPEFDGNQSTLGEFLRLAEELIINFYNPHQDVFQNKFILNSLKNKITGKARDDISTYTVNTWADLRNALLATYSDKRDLHTLTIELCELRQGKLTPVEFFNAIQKNLNLQIAYCNNHFPDAKKIILIENATELGLRIFLKQLNKPLGDYILTRNPATLQEALRILTNDFQINQKLPVVQPFQQQRAPPKFNNYIPQRQFQQTRQFQYQPNQQRQFVQSSVPNKNVFQPKPNFIPRDKPVPMSTSTVNSNNFNKYRRRYEAHNIEQETSDPEMHDCDKPLENPGPEQNNFLGEPASEHLNY